MRLIAVAAASLGLAVPAMAAGFADPGEIDREVAHFTGASIGAEGGARQPVDRRLKLAQCQAPLALEWYGRGRSTVLVSCPVAGGWRLYVPVEGGVALAGAGKAEAIVARGEAVSIVIQGKGFALARQAEALEAGAEGAWIRVSPVGSKGEPLRAQVVAPGRVTLRLP